MMWQLAILGAIGLFVLVVAIRRRRAMTRRSCIACGATPVDRGFLSWNGGTAGDLNMVTAGLANPSERFVAMLKAAAQSAPEPSARMVGALTLFECASCGAKMVNETGVGLRACNADQWRDLTAGAGTEAD